jgi:hypothetical protein
MLPELDSMGSQRCAMEIFTVKGATRASSTGAGDCYLAFISSSTSQIYLPISTPPMYLLYKLPMPFVSSRLLRTYEIRSIHGLP